MIMFDCEQEEEGLKETCGVRLNQQIFIRLQKSWIVKCVCVCVYVCESVYLSIYNAACDDDD